MSSSSFFAIWAFLESLGGGSFLFKSSSVKKLKLLKKLDHSDKAYFGRKSYTVSKSCAQA